jgi:hypothetical protein
MVIACTAQPLSQRYVFEQQPINPTVYLLGQKIAAANPFGSSAYSEACCGAYPDSHLS